MELAGTSALVTGGAGLLGSACVRMLAGRGAHVVVVDPNAPAFADLSADLGAAVSLAPADVRSVDEVAEAVAQAAEHGPLRVVISCAGAWSAWQRTVDRRGEVFPLETFQRIIDVNIMGSFNVMAQAARQMATQPPVDADGQRGVVINVASLAGLEGSAGQVAYATAKAGVAGMTIPAARDLGVVGVRVNAIAPSGRGP